MAELTPAARHDAAPQGASSKRSLFSLSALILLYAAMPWIIRPLELFMAPTTASLVGQAAETAVGIVLGIWTIRLVRRHRAVARQLERELDRAKQGDSMTGLGNGAALARDLELALGRARRTGEPVSLLLLDIDDLGVVNRRQGVSAGDRTLRALASVLRSSARFGTDAAYRVGDDEFAVVLAADRTAAETVRQRLEWNFFERSPARSRFNAGLVTWDGLAGHERLLELARRELFAQQQTGLATQLA